MRIFVAGATGALGIPVLRQLTARGHDVVGMTRSNSKRALIEQFGARAVVADALDSKALTQAVREAAPTHVLHLLTALPKTAHCARRILPRPISCGLPAPPTYSRRR